MFVLTMILNKIQFKNKKNNHQLTIEKINNLPEINEFNIEKVETDNSNCSSV